MGPDRTTTLQDILERLPVAVVVASQETGLIIWGNPLAARLAGADRPAQLAGRSLLEFMDPTQHGVALRDLEAVLRGESPPPVTYHLRQFGGAARDVQISSIPVLFRGQPAMLSVCADVTGAQRAARALAESEQRYRELVENSPDGLVVVDADERIVYANPALAEALGAEREALLTRSMFDFIADGSRKPVREARKRVLTTGKPHPAAPVVLVRADGSELATTAQTTLIRWDGNDATQTIMHDIGAAPGA